ncbi:MAG: hypothetical protein ACR2PA_18205 [Hyphomicrobiaceae bacterium]
MKIRHAALFALVTVCSVLLANRSVLSGSNEPIRIVLASKTSQNVIAHIVGQALIEAGFRFELVKVAKMKITLISSGAAHFDPLFDVPKAREALDRAIHEEKVYSLGGLQANGPDEPQLKVIWVGVRNKWPNAEKLFKRMIMPIDELNAIARSIDAGDVPLEKAVDTWMAENSSTWKSWISASRNWMKP